MVEADSDASGAVFGAILDVFGAIVGGGADDDALGEDTVDCGFPHAVQGVTFAPDGVEFPGATGFGDEVDAGVLDGEAMCHRPIGEPPAIGVEVGVEGVECGRLIERLAVEAKSRRKISNLTVNHVL